MPTEALEKIDAEAEVISWKRREPEVARFKEIEAKEDFLAVKGELLWKELDLLPHAKSGAVATEVDVLLAELLLVLSGL